MIKQLKEERGLTLIEVLAATVIGAIVILLIGNALIFGLKQFKNQSEKSQDLTSVTIVAKAVTKDIRKATSVKVKDGDLILEFEKENEKIIYKFDGENKAILKNEKKHFEEIEIFEVNPSGNLLKIRIKSRDKNGTMEEINTELYIRK